ncbi:unnamed protein product [Paramecium primaurelia]|uniref:Uncharacterized protein n=1 Tax=Paramecium primaurelia TaxID=5886 RepID=A0A8S1K9A5_PARPR|nr:unnamed protein product [Paramecium primaurelia]
MKILLKRYSVLNKGNKGLILSNLVFKMDCFEQVK